ncbi:MAG: hypothetical protein U0528_14225 [Anaerolineae bacterium]
MQSSAIQVRLDDRARLLSAVLAATNYPDQAQGRKKHGTHLHARATRRHVSSYSTHPAASALQSLLDQGIPLAALYGYVLRLSSPGLQAIEETPRWVPAHWSDHLLDFQRVSELDSWWATAQENDHWQTALNHLQEIFREVKLQDVLEPFVGSVKETLVFMPSLSYPTDQNVGVRVGNELIVLIPPPIAWGDSAPWSYKDDPALAFRAALTEYGAMLMNSYLSQHMETVSALSDKSLSVGDHYRQAHPMWQDQFLGLFTASITAMYLEQAISKLEARSYIQHMQRVEHLTVLPAAISVFQRYLNERSEGKYAEFIEFLPHVPKYLRVGKALAPA